MALDKLVDSSQLDGALAYTADAIREKTGEPGNIEWDMDTGFAAAIEDITADVVFSYNSSTSTLTLTY